MEHASGIEGQWIADALERNLTKERWKQCFGTVAATVPDTFAAYARIFHRMDGGNEPERRWMDVAKAKGTRLHPEAQFHRLAKTELYQNALIDGANGVEYWRPNTGEMDQKQLVALADVLGAHTAAQQDIFQAVWVGWGGFEPGTNGIPAGPGTQLTVANGLRAYWVFCGAIEELSRPPWFDENFGRTMQSPNLAWPRDRSWCLATEIDFDSTVVGGSVELIAAVVQALELEAVEVTPSTNLSSEGDTVNV